MENEVCKNCGRAIGKLEQAFVYKGNIVCGRCYEKLNEKIEEPITPAKNTTETVSRKAQWTERRRSWLGRYKDYCGKRSFGFQCWLFVWTILCVLILLYMVGSTKPPTYDGVPLRYIQNPDKRAIAQIPQTMSVCCPLGTWFIFAVPLGIAAIATFGKGK